MTQAIVRRDGEPMPTVIGRDDDFLPIMSVEQFQERYQRMIAIATKIMRAGHDYGVIPGTERPGKDGTPSAAKNVLLKAGAEKLCCFFGLTARFDDYRIIEDWDKGFFYYAYKCTLSRGDREIASCIGSCNSRERKFRRGGRVCPDCGCATIKRSKFPPKQRPDAEPGWYCFEKAGGCGKQFAADDPSILEQTQTTDPLETADIVNTLQKMAQKRAFVGATLIATNASEFFTQDLDDDRPPARAAAGGRGQGHDDEPISDENGVELDPGAFDPTDPADFAFLFSAYARRRGLDQQSADTLLLTYCNQGSINAQTVSAEQRRQLLLKVSKLTHDDAENFMDALARRRKAQPSHTGPGGQSAESGAPKTDAPPVDPVDEALGQPWDDAVRVLRDAANEAGPEPDIAADAFDRGIGQWAMGMKKKGKEAQIPLSERRNLYQAIKERRFDWQTGKITATPATSTAIA